MEKSKSFNDVRTGRFTSSTIIDLMSNGRKADEVGAPFYAACKRVAAEKIFGTKAKSSGESFSCEWGSLAEIYVCESVLKPEDFTVGFSDCPIIHPDKEFSGWWSGTPDALIKDRIAEIKCPTSSERFFDLFGITAQEMKNGDKSHEAKYYWQMVSNAIIAKKDYAELVVFMPTKKDLEAIKEMNRDGALSFRIEWASDDKFPCLSEEVGDLRLYRMVFKVPQEDKDALTNRVRMAIKYTENLIKEKLHRINNI
jgi:hypothetical protein